MRILVVRLSSLGDIIHTIPAFSCLRKARSEDHIGWYLKGKGKEIIEIVQGIDEVVESYKSGKWDITIDFQGLIKSAFVSLRSRAKIRYGFGWNLLKEPLASIFYMKRLKEFSKTHIIEKNLALASFFLGKSCKDIDFPLRFPSYKELDTIFKGKVLINSGGSWKNKRIPPKKITEIARLLKKEGLESVIIWGNEEERLASQMSSLESGASISPPLTIRQVFYAIKISSLIISGDSFPLHAASALRKPVIGIFGPTDPERNGPLPPSKIIKPNLPCHPCWKRKCKNPVCMEEISPQQVVNFSLELLSS